MRKRMIFIVFSLILILAFAVSPAAAITDGEPTEGAHPEVLLLIMDVDGTPTYRCSGTLIAPTVFLTAGHCTSNYPGSPYTGMRVFNEYNVQDDPTYPDPGGPNTVEAAAWFTHPLFETGPFFLHDVGVVILSEPIELPAGAEYGVLPAPNQFDAYKTRRGLNPMTFTSVGYGLQQSFPDAASWKTVSIKIRYEAHPRLIQINVPGFTGDFSMLLSNNANTGGTCFGDSGGPNYLGDSNVVAGITSFGINGNCAGTGGVFRTDRQDVLDFINSHLP